MKVLHGMVEIASQGIMSVKGLRKIGISADMAVWRKNANINEVDYDLKIGHNKILYPFYFFKMICFLIFALVKYDCFHFHFGSTMLPNCWDLRLLKLFKKSMFFEFHGSDIRGVFNREPYTFYPLPPISARKEKIINKILKYADGIILHDEELRSHIPSCSVPIYIVPLRIDVDSIIPSLPKLDEQVPKIVHAPSNRAIKGTEYIIKAIEELDEKVELVLVEKMTLEEAYKKYKEADIIIDQMLICTFGVFSVEAMAFAKPVVSRISDRMLTSFPEEIPIVSADINSLKERLRELISDPEKRVAVGMQSRKYVEHYHDYKNNAKLLRDIYHGKAEALEGKAAFNKVLEYSKE